MVDVPLVGAMRRHAMRQAGLDPDDPAHVAQHERDLDLARGRRAVEELARRGVELGTPDKEELVDLGRAYRPVELAQILDRIVQERAWPRHDWREWTERHRGHHHAANESCPDDLDPGQGRDHNPVPESGRSSHTSPDDVPLKSPEISEMGETSESFPGADLARSTRAATKRVRNATNGQIREQDDDAWSPL